MEVNYSDKEIDRLHFYSILALVLLSVTLYCSTILPFAKTFIAYITVIQVCLSFFIVIVSLNYNSFDFKLFGNFSFYLLIQLLLILFFLISTFWYNSFDLNSLRIILKLFSFPLLIYVFYVVFAKSLYSEIKLFDKFSNYILWFGFFSSIISFLSLFYPLNANYSSIPVAGLFNHPNTTSFIYTISIPVLFYKYFENKIPLAVFGILITMFSISLFLTMSRAGYIATSLAILIITYNKSKKLFLLSIVLIIFVSVTFLLDINFAKTDSNTSRYLLILSAIVMIFSSQREMLWGNGIQNAFVVFEQTKSTLGSVDPVPNPHNVLLLMAMQFGLVLTATFLIFVLSTFLKTFYILRKPEMSERKTSINLCLALTCAILIQNMFEDLLIFPEAFLFSFFIIFLGYLNYSVKDYNKIKQFSKK